MLLRAFHISVDRRFASCFSTMKFSNFALAAAVFASVTNGFAGPQVTPRFALQVRERSFPLTILKPLVEDAHF
jgi:hypothetical protein